MQAPLTTSLFPLCSGGPTTATPQPGVCSHGARLVSDRPVTREHGSVGECDFSSLTRLPSKAAGVLPRGDSHVSSIRQVGRLSLVSASNGGETTMPRTTPHTIDLVNHRREFARLLDMHPDALECAVEAEQAREAAA